MEDVVRQLGYLCLGSRLKRIAERLQADVTRFGEGVGFDIPAGQYPVLAALDRHGALSVGDLVQALGVSQPGVTRSLALLAEKGLIEIERNERDRRQKAVVLSREGRNIVERSKRDVWQHVETAVTGLCAGLSGSLLDQLDAIEAGLDEMSLDRRALEEKAHQRG